ncbi:BBE domain-containing protein [Phenylobacterium sp.]|uniref:BBE domain-containing protein n=1 Tax=Phenylobacterium sp. TaxID=1871053 RepID=UPI0025FE5E1D|nr:BBE domain-containing protein [Phenylobacterium sp.]
MAAAAKAPDAPATAELFRNLRNPFFIGENAALTQALGWTDAWTTKPSEYAAAAESAADVAAAVSETDYFQPDWQTAFWGEHYARLAAIKRRYDPDGLFFVHHSVGSEAWNPDGFTTIA